MSAIAAFIGRILLALIFIVSGAFKLTNLANTEQMIQSVHFPPGLALPAAIFEIVAGLCIVFGIFTRLFSILLAGFCILLAVLFHNNFSDPVQGPVQFAMFMKNFAIAGGFLCLFAQSHLAWSYDSLRERRKADLAMREADLRAAKAQGLVEGARSTSNTL